MSEALKYHGCFSKEQYATGERSYWFLKQQLANNCNVVFEFVLPVGKQKQNMWVKAQVCNVYRDAGMPYAELDFIDQTELHVSQNETIQPDFTEPTEIAAMQGALNDGHLAEINLAFFNLHYFQVT